MYGGAHPWSSAIVIGHCTFVGRASPAGSNRAVHLEDIEQHTARFDPAGLGRVWALCLFNVPCSRSAVLERCRHPASLIEHCAFVARVPRCSGEASW